MTPFNFHTLLSANFYIVCKFNVFQLGAEPSSLMRSIGDSGTEEAKLN